MVNVGIYILHGSYGYAHPYISFSITSAHALNLPEETLDVTPSQANHRAWTWSADKSSSNCARLARRFWKGSMKLWTCPCFDLLFPYRPGLVYLPTWIYHMEHLPHEIKHGGWIRTQYRPQTSPETPKVHFPKMWLSKGLSQTKSSEMRWSHRQLHPAPHEFIRHVAPWSTIDNQPVHKHSCSLVLFLKINLFEGLICDLQQFLVNSNISFWRNSTCNYPKTHPNTISPHLNRWKYELWQKKHVYQQNTSWLSPWPSTSLVFL